MNTIPATHTPGPWTVEKDIGSTPSRVTFRIGGNMQAAISSEQGIAATNASALMSVEEAEANARLIASAPALLTALQELCSAVSCVVCDDQNDGERDCWMKKKLWSLRTAHAVIAKATAAAHPCPGCGDPAGDCPGCACVRP